MSSDSQNECSNNEYDDNGLDSFINNEFNEPSNNKIEMNLENSDAFNFESSNAFKYSQGECDNQESNYEDFGNFTHRYGDNEYECEDEYDNSTSFNGAASFSFDISTEAPSKQKCTVVDIPFDEFDEDTDYKHAGVSDDDAHDYKMIGGNAPKFMKDEAHHLSSPYSNGLVALRVEMTPDDGGVKAEELKSTNYFKDRFEIFKDVISQKNISDKEEDIVCNICLDGNAYQNDDIVFCEACEIAVHQTCYGSEIVDKVPTLEWFCHRCVHCIKNNIHPSTIKCIFCPNKEGPLKRINDESWAHVNCINWITEIWYKNEQYKEGIVIGGLQKWRTSYKCKICNSKYGAVIMCDHGKCNYMFHPTCGIKEELILDWEEMSVMLKLPEDSDVCPVYCPKHLQHHIDNVKAGIEDSVISKYQKNKQPTKKSKSKNKSSFYIEQKSNNVSIDFDGNVDLNLSNEDNDSDGSISKEDYDDEDFNEQKEARQCLKKQNKKRVSPEELQATKLLREQEKQRRQQERNIEKDRQREERKIKQEREKQERAIERKQRKELNKAQKEAKLKEIRKVIIRKPTMIIKETCNDNQSTNQWKTFMEMGKKREQEIIDQKNAKKVTKEKKRLEKDNKKKDEDKKKTSVVLAAKHQKVENKPKNEAFELAKKQYAEEMKKKNSAIVIKTKRTAKQMLRNVPKNIIKKKGEGESTAKEATISCNNANIKEETSINPNLKTDKTQYEKVPAGNFKFQKIQETENSTEKTNNEQEEKEEKEEKKREFVNKPMYNIRNVEVQQSMKNFCNKNKSSQLMKQETQVEIHESKAITNPYFKNLNVTKQKSNLGFQMSSNNKSTQSLSTQTESNYCNNIIVNPIITFEKNIIHNSSNEIETENKDSFSQIDSFTSLNIILSKLKEALSIKELTCSNESLKIQLSGVEQFNFILCTNCNKCVNDENTLNKMINNSKLYTRI